MSGAEDDAASGITSFKSGALSVQCSTIGQLDTGCMEELVFQGFSISSAYSYFTLSGSFLDFPKV